METYLHVEVRKAVRVSVTQRIDQRHKHVTQLLLAERAKQTYVLQEIACEVTGVSSRHRGSWDRCRIAQSTGDLRQMNGDSGGKHIPSSASSVMM